MAIFNDDLGRQIELPDEVNRIVSLVPSLTELLFDLALDKKIVGITKFCELPKEKVNSVAKIGGTKTADVKEILALKPDLVIASKEENVKSQINELSEHCNVWVSDIANLDDAITSINTIGSMTNSTELANQIALKIEEDFGNYQSNIGKTALYMIWRKPYMAAGIDTYINDLLNKFGLTNCLNEIRYPELSIERIKELNPQVVLLSSEPYPFKNSHMKELQDILPNAQIILVDGQMFSWYGSRLTKVIPYFNQLATAIN